MAFESDWDNQFQILRLKKNNVAPYDGVLMPPKDFQAYRTLELQNEKLNDQIASMGLDKAPEPEPTGEWIHYVLWFIIGFGAGAIVVRH